MAHASVIASLRFWSSIMLRGSGAHLVVDVVFVVVFVVVVVAIVVVVVVVVVVLVV